MLDTVRWALTLKSPKGIAKLRDFHFFNQGRCNRDRVWSPGKIHRTGR
jgi:hypothetical protein